MSQDISKLIPPDMILDYGEPEFVGKMPVRQDIAVISADAPKQMKLGWTVKETVGIGIVNRRAFRIRRYRICG